MQGPAKIQNQKGSGVMAKNDELDERKLLILKAIIDDYIESSEPVGSRTVAKKYDMGLSSATIRNEMADLEEMGYISSPHTSAGRVPSTKGYRTYVDKILEPVSKDPALANDIITKLEEKMSDYGKAIKACAEIVSQLTNYIAIGVSHGSTDNSVKALQLVPVDESSALVIVVTEDNSVKSKLVTLDEKIAPEVLIEMSGIINRYFYGKPANTVTLMTLNRIAEEAGISRSALLPFVDAIFDCINECGKDEIYTEGTAQLLRHPEFDSIEKARDFIEMIQDGEMIEKIVSSSEDLGNGLTVSIGTENGYDGMSDFSIVSVKFEVDGTCIGSVSVVGPTRMDYANVISSLEFMKRMLEKKSLEGGGSRLIGDGSGKDEKGGSGAEVPDTNGDGDGNA